MKKRIKNLGELIDKLDDTKKGRMGLWAYFIFGPLGSGMAGVYLTRKAIGLFSSGDGAFLRYMQRVRKDEEMARKYYQYRSRF